MTTYTALGERGGAFSDAKTWNTTHGPLETDTELELRLQPMLDEVVFRNDLAFTPRVVKMLFRPADAAPADVRTASVAGAPIVLCTSNEMFSVDKMNADVWTPLVAGSSVNAAGVKYGSGISVATDCQATFHGALTHELTGGNVSDNFFYFCGYGTNVIFVGTVRARAVDNRHDGDHALTAFFRGC